MNTSGFVGPGEKKPRAFSFYIWKNKVLPHESISVFDIFKIGVGPSSSHTLLEKLDKNGKLEDVVFVRVLLYSK